MKEKIQEVHDYFKNKLLTGDFEIKSFNFGTITVLIDKVQENYIMLNTILCIYH